MAADRSAVRAAPLLPVPAGAEPGAAASAVAGKPERRVPVPMNLFGTCEIERSSPSCVPRLCSLTLKKLLVLRELDRELSSIVIAVKIQGSKRTLRSHEYLLPSDGRIETELELTFSLQYHHFLKRPSNLLHVMLQRRRRYKNRTIRGFKTLAVGLIDMSEVMQHPTDGDTILGLHTNLKDFSVRGAELSLTSLSSQPIEQEDTVDRHGNKTKASDGFPDRENWWDDDDDSFSSELEGSDDAAPPQQLYGDDDDGGHRRMKASSRKMIPPASQTQLNFKQKFVALLKRFKVTDEVLSPDTVGQNQEAEEDLDLLYDSLEVYNRSDSDDELEDSDSIQSTPKPKLRPFFEGAPQADGGNGSEQSSRQEERTTTGRRTAPAGGGRTPEPDEAPGEDGSPSDEEEEEVAMATDPTAASRLCKTESLTHISARSGGLVSRHQRSVSLKERQNFRDTDRTSSMDSETSLDCRTPAAQVVRKSVLDQLNSILFSDDHFPESIILINTTDWQGQYLSEVLFDQPMVCTVSTADVQAAFAAVLSRIQRYCNCNSQAPPTLKVAVGGDQTYLSSVLGCFVEQLATKTPDWLNYIRFLILPVGVHPLARYVASLDARFASLFMDAGWRELFGRSGPPAVDGVGVPGRVSQYLTGAAVSHLCPISEAMLTCRHRRREEESCQKFVPFIGLVKVGLLEPNSATTSVDSDDISLVAPPTQSGTTTGTTSPPSPSASCPVEAVGLQLDYWSHHGGGGTERRKEAPVKNTLRSNLRCLQASRLNGGELLSMTVVTKEKNKKVMFLSKKMKEKEAESRSQVIDGVTRLICTSKHQHTMRVCVDGVERSDVKFFQLAAQWPTHVKHFPVGIFGYSNA